MATPEPPIIEGPGRGKAFFDRAKTVAATGNYDFAIEMSIQGLNREPDNVEEHKALRDTALRRKVTGGKPAGGLLGPKGPYKGKTPKEAMLNAEWILAKDVGNIPAMVTILRNAVAGEWKETAFWIASILKDANRTTKTPKMELFIEMTDIFEKMGEYKRALEMLQEAIRMKPTDMEMDSRAKDIAAKETLQKGNYEKGESFKESIKDKDMTKKLNEEENLNRSEEYKLDAIAKAKVDYDANPKEVQNIAKYSRALWEMDDEQYDAIAMEMLTKAYAETNVYRFKVDVGNFKMRQWNRNVRMLKEAFKSHPDDAGLKEQLAQALKDRLNFELLEFEERAEHFPTDLLVRYEYGVRLYELKRYDDAIVAFQTAQNSPKHRVDALHKLGRSFFAQNMIPEALDTFKKSIDEYDLAASGDKKSKEYHYYYALALEQNGNTAEAIDIYSKIVRWDISYRDARARLNNLRAQAAGGAA
jgi:tetratricopeptide (TPR) repeat protein